MKHALIVSLAVSGLMYAQGPGQGKGAPEIVPHRTNPQGAGAPTAGSAGAIKPGIQYRGGPVMNAPAPYLIWYGNWNQSNGSDNPGGQQIVRDAIFGLSASNYYMTNASYSGVSGSLNVAGFLGNGANGSHEINDPYSQGSNLSDSQVASIVSTAIAQGLGGPGGDSNGIYFVLTSSDVNESSGFCTQYCGWHTYGTLGSKSIKYAFVGNANRCLNSCAAQTTGPNGNAGVDGMISVIAHEMEETNTDPELNAWFSAKGAEDADMCAWTFGSSQLRLPGGAYYNMTLAGISMPTRNYLIQRELDVNSKCYVDYVNKKQ
uniref:Phosphate-responsive 1 family protein n=1 Tax=Solibacter usitatus (strain Ellin6076) TaxID=234267 RepID=Q01T32_SOLUE